MRENVDPDDFRKFQGVLGRRVIFGWTPSQIARVIDQVGLSNFDVRQMLENEELSEREIQDIFNADPNETVVQRQSPSEHSKNDVTLTVVLAVAALIYAIFHDNTSAQPKHIRDVPVSMTPNTPDDI